MDIISTIRQHFIEDTLRLSEVSIPPEQFPAFSHWLQSSSIRVLRMGNCKLGDEQLSGILSNAPETLEEMHLRANAFTDESAPALFGYLVSSRSQLLRVLNLEGNPGLADETGLAMYKAFMIPNAVPALRVVHLGRSKLSDIGIFNMACVLRSRPELRACLPLERLSARIIVALAGVFGEEAEACLSRLYLSGKADSAFEGGRNLATAVLFWAQPDAAGLTPLRFAIGSGSIEDVQVLLRLRVPVDPGDLTFAVESGASMQKISVLSRRLGAGVLDADAASKLEQALRHDLPARAVIVGAAGTGKTTLYHHLRTQGRFADGRMGADGVRTAEVGGVVLWDADPVPNVGRGAVQELLLSSGCLCLVCVNLSEMQAQLSCMLGEEPPAATALATSEAKKSNLASSATRSPVVGRSSLRGSGGGGGGSFRKSASSKFSKYQNLPCCQAEHDLLALLERIRVRRGVAPSDPPIIVFGAFADVCGPVASAALCSRIASTIRGFSPLSAAMWHEPVLTAATQVLSVLEQQARAREPPPMGLSWLPLFNALREKVDAGVCCMGFAELEALAGGLGIAGKKPLFQAVDVLDRLGTVLTRRHLSAGAPPLVVLSIPWLFECIEVLSGGQLRGGFYVRTVGAIPDEIVRARGWSDIVQLLRSARMVAQCAVDGSWVFLPSIGRQRRWCAPPASLAGSQQAVSLEVKKFAKRVRGERARGSVFGREFELLSKEEKGGGVQLSCFPGLIPELASRILATSGFRLAERLDTQATDGAFHLRSDDGVDVVFGIEKNARGVSCASMYVGLGGEADQTSLLFFLFFWLRSAVEEACMHSVMWSLGDCHCNLDFSSQTTDEVVLQSFFTGGDIDARLAPDLTQFPSISIPRTQWEHRGELHVGGEGYLFSLPASSQQRRQGTFLGGARRASVGAGVGATEEKEENLRKVVKKPHQSLLLSARYGLLSEIHAHLVLGSFPGILPLLGVCRGFGSPLLVFPRAEHGNLLQIPDSATIGLRLRLAADLCRALCHLHAHPMVNIHCDLHPGNVLVRSLDPAADRRESLVWLCDFGRATHGSGGLDVSLGAAWRTTAPETWSMAAAAAPYFQSADMFSLGLCLFQLLARNPAHRLTQYAALTNFHGGDEGSIRDDILYGGNTSSVLELLWMPGEDRANAFLEGCPGELVDVMEKCLERDPRDRPPSVDLVDFLESRMEEE